MKVPLLAIQLVLVAPSFAGAQQNCGDMTDQSEMNSCAVKAYQASDTELNKLYKEIEARLKDDKDTTKLLIAAQKSWIGFRDAECNFSSSIVVTGSVYPFVLNSCLEGLTSSRINDLKGYLSCEEGDMSCPVPAAN